MSRVVGCLLSDLKRAYHDCRWRYQHDGICLLYEESHSLNHNVDEIKSAVKEKALGHQAKSRPQHVTEPSWTPKVSNNKGYYLGVSAFYGGGGLSSFQSI
jgi:hypothetical protein